MDKTFKELVTDMDQIGMKIRMHIMKIPLPDREKHATKLCDECRPWFIQKTALAKELYLVRQTKPTTPSVSPFKGVLSADVDERGTKNSL